MFEKALLIGISKIVVIIVVYSREKIYVRKNGREKEGERMGARKGVCAREYADV